MSIDLGTINIQRKFIQQRDDEETWVILVT